jgi:hypothetical protein
MAMAGAGPKGPSTFPAVAAMYAVGAILSNQRPSSRLRLMVTRGEILWLGIAAGTTGGLIGGMMLGIGMDLMVNGQYLGLILICIGGPASAVIGWLMARRLASQLQE